MKTYDCEHLTISAASADTLSVDEDAKIIRGFVVAQLGAFRSAGRGEFDDKSLRQIERLMKQGGGLESNWGHIGPNELGKFLGRARNPRVEKISVRRDGERQEVPAVLADLHLDPTSFNTPHGDLGGYLLRLAMSDPRAFGASLTLDAAKEFRMNRGRQLTDDRGQLLPPIWRPLELASIDVVRQGEAVDSFLPTKLTQERVLERLTALERASDDGLILELELLTADG